MKIWVVKTSEMLASDNASGRLLRSGLVAEALDARGHEVDWWMSTFDHAQRRQRAECNENRPFGSRSTIRMVSSPGYRSSVSIGRLVDHVVWGRRFAAAIAQMKPPDLVLCSYPTIESAWIATRFG